MKKYKFIILAIIILLLVIPISILATKFRAASPSKRTIILTIDDVSPAYSLEQHKKLFEIIDKYSVPATLFVIPNYKDKYPINSDGAWINLIKEEQRKGYEIAQHGYNHSPYEFALLDYDKSKEKLILGRKLLEDVFGPSCGFRPPNWAENYEVRKALKDLHYCYDANVYALKFEHGWKTNVWIAEFLKTMAEYEIVTGAKKPFILVLHVQSMTNEGYKYLDEFLAFARKNKAVFKTYRDVYGDRQTGP